MSDKCAVKNCSFDKHANYEECILHCSKEKMSSISSPYFTEPEKFYNHLVDYIASQAFRSSKESQHINKDSLVRYMHELLTADADSNANFLKNKKIIFTNVSFPNTDDREEYNYEKLLKKLGKICFNYCSFYITSIDLMNIECFFQYCEFYEDWTLLDYKASQELENLEVYKACIFYDSVTAFGREKERYTLSYIQFNGCIFNSDLNFENIDAKKSIFNDWKGFESKVKYLKVHDSNFYERFVLNKYCVEEVDLKNTVFKSKFEFTNNCTKIFNIDNCNFEMLSEFYNSRFEKFKIFKSIFQDYTGFEKSEFGKEISEKDYVSKFTYVTFLNFINFRNTKFKSGLSLEDTNMKESPNFLNTKIDSKNTSRETFRIIKHSFDKIGNHIEANKFFSQEMGKYKYELKHTKNNKQEKFIFWLNDLVSNFGQSYLKPLGWLLLVAFIYSLIFYAFKCGVIQEGTPMHFLNAATHSFLPFKKFLPDKLEFLTLIFMLIQSMLIWHIAVAVKRHTKR